MCDTQESIDVSNETVASEHPRHSPRSAQRVGEGFLPAFQDVLTGQVVLSSFDNGRQAPMHLLNALPAHWFIPCQGGAAAVLKSTVIAGFWRQGRFYTRAEAAEPVCSSDCSAQ